MKTCSILTTTPNAVTSAIHDRMPVILDPDSYDLWLDPGMKDVSAASDMLKPYDARLMRCYPVSTLINHVANDEKPAPHPWNSRRFSIDYSYRMLADCCVYCLVTEDKTCVPSPAFSLHSACLPA